MVNEQIVNEFMAKVEYADLIKTVSGALVKINKKSQHAQDQKMVLGTHRVAPTQSKACTRIYLRGLAAVTRSTQPSSHELDIRERFAAVAAMVKVRAKDLTKIDDDQAAFLAQRDTAAGKKTMRAYLWLVCGAEYDQQHG